MPTNTPRKLLILDLDETLIYAADAPMPGRTPDFLVLPYFIYKRPHLDAFLAGCLAQFDVAVWTSSSSDYAAEVVAAIFPDPSSLVFVWARDRCRRRFNPELEEAYWHKPLHKVLRRANSHDRGSIIAVDDSPEKWELSYGNLVRVRPFEGNPNDDELPELLHYLRLLAAEPDVCRLEKRGWRNRGKNEL